MANIKVAIKNVSTVVGDPEVAALVAALQKQVDNDFAPAWGCPADLRVVGPNDPEDPQAWGLLISDNSDLADDLGYHELTRFGQPMGKAFAKSAIDAGASWTVTVSHELLEMLADPNINLAVLDQGPFGARLYSYEVCDPCEDDRFGYLIDGLLVSDFVYPAWFESFWVQGTAVFDFGQHINAPFQLLAGGYAQVNDIASGLGWSSESLPGEMNVRARPPRGSRRQRRSIAPSQRLRSTAKF